MNHVQRICAETTAGNVQRMRVRAFTFEERTPPKEIQLWNPGDNPTDYGVHKWTTRSVADVGGRYELRGNPLLIDVEHNGAKNPDDAEPTTTGGYARLELRAGVPWLVFDWSAYAVDQIKTGQRRFLSPEYDVDRTTGEIVALYRVSLVADPGTHRARMLAAAKQETGMDPKLAAIMAILKSVADPAAAVEAIQSLVANLDGGDAAGAGAGAADAAGAGAATEGETATADAGGGGDASGDNKDKEDKVAAAAKVAAGAKPAGAAPAAATGAAPPPAAAAPPAATVAAGAAQGAGPDVKKVAAAAVEQIENAQRDHLIATQGDRLDPSIRRWASTQALAIVNGLINAAPEKQAPLGRVTATRGATQGTEVKPGLQGDELVELKKQMGTFQVSAPEPHETANGVIVLPSVPPGIHRERMRAAAAATAAGKAGK